MTERVEPGAGVLFMKVGTHAKETLADIIARKSKEIEETGFALWGYGGNTCHPRTMVQPFAADFENRQRPIYLCMQEMDSKHFAEPLRATEFSTDGTRWEQIPDTVNVLGSRFALVLEDLCEVNIVLPLSETKVAVGLSKGRPGDKYIRGQVDKACLEVIEDSRAHVDDGDINEIYIGLMAKLKKPYAVFLRDHR